MEVEEDGGAEGGEVDGGNPREVKILSGSSTCERNWRTTTETSSSKWLIKLAVIPRTSGLPADPRLMGSA